MVGSDVAPVWPDRQSEHTGLGAVAKGTGTVRAPRLADATDQGPS